jgi:hypothetical protein
MVGHLEPADLRRSLVALKLLAPGVLAFWLGLAALLIACCSSCFIRPSNSAPEVRDLRRRQRRAKVRVALPDDANHFGTQSRRIAAVARPAAPS